MIGPIDYGFVTDVTRQEMQFLSFSTSRTHDSSQLISARSKCMLGRARCGDKCVRQDVP